jgi:hypothetical protein
MVIRALCGGVSGRPLCSQVLARRHSSREYCWRDSCQFQERVDWYSRLKVAGQEI